MFIRHEINACFSTVSLQTYHLKIAISVRFPSLFPGFPQILNVSITMCTKVKTWCMNVHDVKNTNYILGSSFPDWDLGNIRDKKIRPHRRRRGVVAFQRVIMDRYVSLLQLQLGGVGHVPSGDLFLLVH